MDYKNKIRYHRLFRVSRFDRTDEHTAFVISAYNRESVNVGFINRVIIRLRKINMALYAIKNISLLAVQY